MSYDFDIDGPSPYEDDAYEAAQRNMRNLREECDAMRLRIRGTISDSQITSNKFYVGSRSALEKHWGHRNLESAVAHAKELIAKSDEDQFVVQIVRVVKRQAQPIIVKRVGRGNP